MNYAIIENGICTNIIISEKEFAESIGAVELPDGFGIGDSYVDGVWTKKEVQPVPPTEEERITALEEAVLVMMEV